MVGEIFTLRIKQGYLFGRVISTSAYWAVDPAAGGANLIYIYKIISRKVQPLPVENLKPDSLLAPPIMTNNLGWARGYFETITAVPLRPADMLEEHCFEDVYGAYFNELGEQIPAAQGPVGTYGLASYLSIDTRVGQALATLDME